eukprot:gnl/MRDRNA2_/MRDRNA2_28064_c0_seq1.p2 gnl/MRDRNA2_/MRDRNA2_28064_c0~~gnl/MRDRNA2_/MRDRNA2_28064_c0_seq1.p2  ORF type:complete len:111 (+),score=18.04 gnl/MRDRNA2_/MRDRNA2_28064_c0_seq1:70-402(+)
MVTASSLAGGILGCAASSAYYFFGVLEVSLAGAGFGVCLSQGASPKEKKRLRIPILLRGLTVSACCLGAAYSYGSGDDFLAGLRMGALVPSAVTAVIGSLLLVRNSMGGF